MAGFNRDQGSVHLKKIKMYACRSAYLHEFWLIVCMSTFQNEFWLAWANMHSEFFSGEQYPRLEIIKMVVLSWYHWNIFWQVPIYFIIAKTKTIKGFFFEKMYLYNSANTNSHYWTIYTFCRFAYYTGKVWAGLHTLKDIKSASGKNNLSV